MEIVVTAAGQSPFYGLCSHQYHSFCGLCCKTVNYKKNIVDLFCSVQQLEDYPL